MYDAAIYSAFLSVSLSGPGCQTWSKFHICVPRPVQSRTVCTENQNIDKQQKIAIYLDKGSNLACRATGRVCLALAPALAARRLRWCRCCRLSRRFADPLWAAAAADPSDSLDDADDAPARRPRLRCRCRLMTDSAGSGRVSWNRGESGRLNESWRA